MKHFLSIFLSLFMLLNQSNAKMYLVTERGTTLTAWNTKDKACDYSAYYGAEKAKKICKKDGFVISLRTKEDKNSWRKGDCGTCKTYSSKKIKCESEGTIGCLEASFRKVNAKVFNITGKSQEKACKRAKSKAKNAARSRCSNGTQKYKLIKDKENDISECSCQEQSSSASNSKFSCSGTHESMCKFVAKSDISKEEIKEFVERVGSIRGKNNEIREIIKSGELEGYDKERAQVATNTSDAFLDQGEKQFYEGEKELGDEFVSVGKELTDLALGLTPGVSVGKDAYELFSGKNLVTGEQLTSTDRAFAGLGLFTLGGSNYIKAAGKILSKMSKFGLGDYRKAVRLGSTLSNNIVNKKWSKLVDTSGDIRRILRPGRDKLLSKIRKDLNIPSGWSVDKVKKGKGITFHKPDTKKNFEIRVMNGKSESKYLNSQRPYVTVKNKGNWLDKNGKVLPNNRNEDAHIPLDHFEGFIFKWE